MADPVSKARLGLGRWCTPTRILLSEAEKVEEEEEWYRTRSSDHVIQSLFLFTYASKLFESSSGGLILVAICSLRARSRDP